MKKLTKTMMFCISLAASTVLRAQFETSLLRLDTVTYHGVTDTVDMMPILINTNGNVVISGNQKISATQYNAETIAQLSDGTTSWINQFNPSNQKAFITASCNDGAGNVYNVGGVQTGTTNGMDFLVMKLDMGGNVLWTQTVNGGNSTNDCATGVCVDATGQVFVTGASDGAGTALIDFLTLCFTPAGSIAWSQSYNFNDQIDVPAAIACDAATNELIVSGASGNSLFDYDFATVRYDQNGNFMGDVRIPGAGVGQDKVFGMATDGDGNVYVAGTTWSGTNYDLQLVKLDTALNVVFTRTLDVNGFDDAGISVKLDPDNNIIVAGSTYLSPTTRELLVVKYDNSGNLKWQFKRGPSASVQSAEALRLHIKSVNEYFIAGNYGSGGAQDIVLLCLDSVGQMKIEKTFDGHGYRDRLMDFTMSGNEIYVSARTMTASNATLENNITIKYTYNNYQNNPVTVGSGVSASKYVNHDLIVQFNKATLKMNRINNREFTFGKLGDFVTDSTCDKIEQFLDPEGLRGLDATQIDTRKIFFDLTEADSLSQTRLGDYVKVPPFYCNLLLRLPPMANTPYAAANMRNLKPDILNSQHNHIFDLTSQPPPNTNDPIFTNDQGALHPVTNYTTGHINVDSAWAYTTGVPGVRVGIYDSGIEQNHPDLSASFAGFNFANNTNLNGNDLDNHGTLVAGIIGAKRNNGTGVAGVAGGDATSSQQGVTLYDCKVTSGGAGTEASLAAAITKGAQGSNIGGFALNVMNMSLRFYYGWSINLWANGVSKVLIESMNFANRNGVAMNCSKGNIPALGTWTFPADWNEYTTMSVGSSGHDGHWCSYTNNCTNGSTQWGNIDFLAPGTYELVTSTDNTGGYQTFDGTSSATSFVSGATALMMSYRNSSQASWDNLVHEDCENILEKTCTDLAGQYNETVGYDSISGWGRINVHQAIRAIDKQFYRIRHITESVGNTGLNVSTSKVFTGPMLWTNYQALPTGTYVTEIYEKTSTISFALLPSEKIIDWWPLTKECYGTKLDSTFVDFERPNYSLPVSLTNNTAVMKTYYYKIPGQNNLEMPYTASNIRSGFTLYTYDSTGTVSLPEELAKSQRFTVYPNPSQEYFTIEHLASVQTEMNYSLVNILGQEVTSGKFHSVHGKNKVTVGTDQLDKGVYILTIFDNKRQVHYQKKVIKQ